MNMLGNRIAISVGHTLLSPGAKNADGLYEQPFNYRVALRVQRHLKLFSGIDMDILLREQEDYKGHCKDMVRRCNGNYDYVYDLHFNSSTFIAKGAEILCLAETEGAKVAKFLADKMKQSGWEMRGSNGVSPLSITDRGFGLLTALEKIGVATVIVEPCFGSNQMDPNYSRVFFNNGEGYAIFLANFLKEYHYGN